MKKKHEHIMITSGVHRGEPDLARYGYEVVVAKCSKCELVAEVKSGKIYLPNQGPRDSLKPWG